MCTTYLENASEDFVEIKSIVFLFFWMRGRGGCVDFRNAVVNVFVILKP